MWMENFRDSYILVELTDFCNYNCVMCCHDRPEGPHSSKQGFMDAKLFEKIINELPVVKAATGLKLFWLGEPFLNPLFPDMLKRCIEILREKKANYYIDLHTNAFFLSDDIIELLLKNSDYIPRITLSLDAVYNDTYKKIRRKGNLDKVVNNIDRFLKRRKEGDFKGPSLIFQFIVMDENHQEAGDFAKFWEDRINKIKGENFSLLKKITDISGYKLGKKITQKFNYDENLDVIWMKRLDTTPDKYEHFEKLYIDTMEKNSLKSEIKKNIEIIVSAYNLWDKEQEEKVSVAPARRPCSGLWKTPSIKWDGELTVCCFDPSMELSIGNLRENTFSELWFSEKLNEMRKYHLEGEFDKVLTHEGYKKCLGCSGLDTPFLSDEEIQMYIKENE